MDSEQPRNVYFYLVIFAIVLAIIIALIIRYLQQVHEF
jgi:hypothetical protein